MANYFQSLTPQGRTIVAVIVTAVVAVGLFFGVKAIRSYLRRNEERKNPAEVVNDADKDIKIEADKGQTLTHPSSTYSSSSNAISTLLDGCESFTSEMNVVENIITTVKKPIDWYNLIKVFGVREISQCGSFGQIKDSVDLSSLLKDQLDSSGIYNINIGGYTKSGFAFETINVLRDYFKTIGITI